VDTCPYHQIAASQDSNARQGKFGFAVDNTIGGTSQPNGWMDNWVDFFRQAPCNEWGFCSIPAMHSLPLVCSFPAGSYLPLYYVPFLLHMCILIGAKT